MDVVSFNSPKSGLEVEGVGSGGTSGGIAALVIDILTMKKIVATDSPKNVGGGGGSVGTNDVVGVGTSGGIATLVIDILNMKIVHTYYGLPACILTLIIGALVDTVLRVCKSVVPSDTGKPHSVGFGPLTRAYCDFMSCLGRSSLK